MLPRLLRPTLQRLANSLPVLAITGPRQSGMTRLLPLAAAEIPSLGSGQLNLDNALLMGGYPALHAQAIQPADWFASYIATYAERDVRQVLNIQNLPTFQRFLRLCAGRAGQLLNVSALASEAGITANTAKSWLAVLESSDLIHSLPPYFRNFGKRLVKAPKLYCSNEAADCKWSRSSPARPSPATPSGPDNAPSAWPKTKPCPLGWFMAVTKARCAAA